MRETLRALILDFQEARLETGVRRRVTVRPVSGKAAVLIGVRRCGKSTWAFQQVEQLVADGVPRENVLYVNFFDDRLAALQKEGPGLVAETYWGLYPEKQGKETVHCFFDEIQVVPGWEAFVERLLRTEKCRVTITGSSARMLSKEIATQMRGRALSWELFPFSFREFLDGRGLDAAGPLSTRRRRLVEKAFGDYLETGGFPEVVGLEPALRVKTHQEYFHAILYRDLVDRHDVAHPKAVSDLARWLVDHTGSLYTVNSLTGYLKALGHNAPKAAVSSWLEWFEDAYFLYTVSVFDASLARRNTNPKKVYCVDHALVRSVSSGILVNSGHLLENLVFVALRRNHPELYYFKTRGGREVDFVVPGRGRPQALVQACETLADPETRKREVAALEAAMEETGLREATIVTRHESESLRVGAGAIEVVPAWRFLLDQPG